MPTPRFLILTGLVLPKDKSLEEGGESVVQKKIKNKK